MWLNPFVRVAKWLSDNEITGLGKGAIDTRTCGNVTITEQVKQNNVNYSSTTVVHLKKTTKYTMHPLLLRRIKLCLTIIVWGVILKKIEWILTLFVTDVTPWLVTSVITSFGVNIEWTGRDFTRWVVKFHSTWVRIEWNSLLNEWNFHRWSELFTRFIFERVVLSISIIKFQTIIQFHLKSSFALVTYPILKLKTQLLTWNRLPDDIPSNVVSFFINT